MNRITCLQFLLLVSSAFAALSVAEAAGPDTLYSGNRRIAAARFHVILYFDERHRDVSNQAHVLNVIQKFTDDLREEDNQSGLLPINLEVNTTRSPTLSNARALTTYLDTLAPQIESDDVVFLWLECEGSDETLDLTGGAMSRKALATRLRFGNRPRLTVFITDACRIIPGAPNSDALALLPEEGGATNRIWRALYFGHRGLVDLRSAGPGQAAFTLGDKSVFATTFRNLFYTPNIIDKIDPNTPEPQQFAEWSRFVNILNGELKETSGKVKRDYLKDDGRPTDAGKDLDTATLQLLKHGQQAELVPQTFVAGARPDIQ